MSRAKKGWAVTKDLKAGNKACVASGYAYSFWGRNWRGSKDDLWETVMLSKKHCGQVVGKRRIDGAPATVLRVRGKYVAALPSAFSQFRGAKRR